MTMPNVSAPNQLGAAGRPSRSATFHRISARRPSGPRRSMRDLTPFIFLAMILIPSLIVLCLAIADPGASPPELDAPHTTTVAPGP